MKKSTRPFQVAIWRLEDVTPKTPFAAKNCFTVRPRMIATVPAVINRIAFVSFMVTPDPFRQTFCRSISAVCNLTTECRSPLS